MARLRRGNEDEATERIEGDRPVGAGLRPGGTPVMVSSGAMA